MEKRKRFHSFRYKMCLVGIFLTVIPTCLVSSIQYYYSSKLVESQSQEYLQDVVDWTCLKVMGFMDEVEDITFSVVSNGTVQAVISRLDREQDRFERYKDNKELREQLSSYALLKDYISNISIVTDGGSTCSYNKNRSVADLGIDKEEVYQADGRVVYGNVSHKQKELVVARKINSLKRSDSLGYVAVTVQESYLDGIINAFGKMGEGKAYLLDQEDCVISAEEKELVGSIFSQKDWNQKEFFYYTSDEMENGWKVVAAISVSYFKENARNLKNIFYLIAILVACLVVVVVIQLSGRVVKSLVSLSEQMKRFGKGHLEARCEIPSEDEFGMLAETFNKMAVKIQRLLDEVYKQKYLRQKAQMQSLQMQINPHFLYNTLDTVNWMARMQGMDEIGDIAAALGNLMRSALRPDVYVTLEQEAAGLKDYIQIQEYRYGQRLMAQVLIPEELYGCGIPKLVVQPILENAIVHGMEGKVERTQVTVTGEREGETLYIWVKDDGIGMEQEAIDRIFQEGKAKEGERGSIGLCNVHKRLVMYYGEGFGIQIFSKPGQGTEVMLKMKVQLYNEIDKNAEKRDEFLIKELENDLMDW